MRARHIRGGEFLWKRHDSSHTSTSCVRVNAIPRDKASGPRVTQSAARPDRGRDHSIMENGFVCAAATISRPALCRPYPWSQHDEGTSILPDMRPRADRNSGSIRPEEREVSRFGRLGIGPSGAISTRTLRSKLYDVSARMGSSSIKGSRRSDAIAQKGRCVGELPESQSIGRQMIGLSPHIYPRSNAVETSSCWPNPAGRVAARQ